MMAWLPGAVELGCYESIRRGSEEAFRTLATPLQPTLRRLAGLYVDSETSVDAVVLLNWCGVLRALEVFRWHTPLATWIAKGVVELGRPRHARAREPTLHAVKPVRRHEVPGPPDWSDLPWTARWERAGETLDRALESLPVDQREVIHGRDGEQWPPRRVCDVFGLPEVVHDQLLADARRHLHAELAQIVGQTNPSDHERDAQVAAITTWLSNRIAARTGSERLDPRTVAAFRRWSARRHGPSSRVPGPPMHTPRQ